MTRILTAFVAAAVLALGGSLVAQTSVQELAFDAQRRSAQDAGRHPRRRGRRRRRQFEGPDLRLHADRTSLRDARRQPHVLSRRLTAVPVRSERQVRPRARAGRLRVQRGVRLRVDPQDNVWTIDIGANQVVKFDTDGRIALVLGRKPETINVRPGASPGPAGIVGSGVFGSSPAAARRRRPLADAADLKAAAPPPGGRGSSRMAAAERRRRGGCRGSDAAVRGGGHRRPRRDPARPAPASTGPPTSAGTRPATSTSRTASATRTASRSSTRTAGSSSTGARPATRRDSSAASRRSSSTRRTTSTSPTPATSGSRCSTRRATSSRRSATSAPRSRCASLAAQRSTSTCRTSAIPTAWKTPRSTRSRSTARCVGKFGKAGKMPKEFGIANSIDCRSENELLVGEMTNWRVQRVTLKK